MGHHLKQSAKEELLAAKIPAVCVEFFDHYSYCAAAISRSRNPVKAAMTLLEKENIREELEKFIIRTRHKEKPKLPEAILPMLRNLGVDPHEQYVEPDPEDDPDFDPDHPGPHGPFGKDPEDY
jgi:hypothetical protein